MIRNTSAIAALLVGSLTTLVLSSSFSNRAFASADELPYLLSFEELKKINIVTASKSEESILQAPSVVSVITREDIIQQGFKSLDEALERVPGYFMSRNKEWGIVGSRGIITQTNKQYLMLINGHPNNSLIFTGFHNEHEYPLLDKVERIEVVRGPGSTLWGSDAVLGIINIITRKGSEIDGFEFNLNGHKYYPVNRKPRGTIEDIETNISGNPANDTYRKGQDETFNITYGAKHSKDVHGMFSFTYFDGDGFELDVEGPNTADFERQSFDIDNPDPRTPGFDMLSPRQDWGESWELLTNIVIGDFQVTARGAYVSHLDYLGSFKLPYYQDGGRPHIQDEWRIFWLEAEQTNRYSNNSMLINKFFVDSIYQDKNSTGDTDRISESDRLYEERAFGFDSLYTFNVNQHNFKLGGRFTVTNFGPMIGARIVPDEDTVGGFVTEEGQQYYRADRAKDTAIGLFVEDNWNLRDDLKIVLGLRIDSNDVREDKEQLLPRFAIISPLSDGLVLKYLLNTGYRRPSYWESIRTFDGNPQSTASEKVIQHDLQLLFSSQLGEFSINPYYLRVYKYIDWITRFGNGNIGDIQSFGLEIDGKKYFENGLSLYGNVSYNHTEVKGAEVEKVFKQVNPDLEIIGMPRFIYNLGMNYKINDHFRFNFHARGWNTMAVYDLSKFEDTYGELSGGSYFDFNLVYRPYKNDRVITSFFIRNLLNEDTMIADNFKGGSLGSEPKSLGFKITAKLD